MVYYNRSDNFNFYLYWNDYWRIKMNFRKLEKMLREESKGLTLTEQLRLYKSVADYILNICPKHYSMRKVCEHCKYEWECKE
jgi:hypothetical protein